MVTVYCDESGYSGPNLYLDAIPYFVYASVAIEPAEARETVDYIKTFFRRFQGEVKFSSLSKTKQGRNALTRLLDKHGSQVKLWFANKKYATAGKLFDYVFEPVLAENSALFYTQNFHRFIANLLYLGLKAREETSERMLSDFQKMIREMDGTGLTRLLGENRDRIERDPFCEDIAAFAFGYRDAIPDEVNTLKCDETAYPGPTR